MTRTIEEIDADMKKLEEEKKTIFGEERKKALKECKRLIREYGIRPSEVEKSFTTRKYKNSKTLTDIE